MFEGTINPTRRFNIVLVVMIIVAMGPYVVSSFRVEHFIIYPLGVLVVLTRWRTIHNRIMSSGLLVMGPWLLIIVIGLVASVVSPMVESRWGYGSFLAGADNMLMPLTVALVVIGMAPSPTTTDSLKVVWKTIVALGVLNGVVAVANMMAPAVSDLLRPFWGAEDTDSTVADRAMTMGRFSGIFNQPAEAGLFYSIAAIAAVAVFSNNRRLMWPALLVITVGGMLTVSKVFLFIGLPIAVVYLMVRSTPAQRVTSVVTVAAMLVAIFSTPFIRNWSGLDYLFRFAETGQQSVLELFTAGRWNEGSTLLGVIEYVLHSSPVIGVGLRGLDVPYDSAWTEVFIYAGLIGVGLMVTVYLALFFYSVLLQEPWLRTFGLMLSLVLLGASFGISSLTLNRVSILIWVMMAIIICLPKGEPDHPLAKTFMAGRHRLGERALNPQTFSTT